MNTMRMELEDQQTTLPLSWSGDRDVRSAAIGGVGTSARGARRTVWQRIDFRCPGCDSIVYSRRNKLCGVCGDALPEEFLFNPYEARRVESLMRSEQERHRKWMARSAA